MKQTWSIAFFCLGLSALQGCAASSRAMYAGAPPPMASQSQAPSSIAQEAAPSSGDADGSGGQQAQPQAPPPEAPSVPGVAGARGPGTNTGAAPAAPNSAAPAPAPMLIYTADIELQTARDEMVAVIDRIIESSTAMGGYLLRRTDTSVQIRVPSQRFRESLRRVEGYGEVLHRTVAAQDVSEEFNDLEVRLQNLRAVRRRLEEFLQRAGTMAEALQVERELERVTREIDTVEGRMRFLSARVAFSLVTVNLRARPEASVAAAPPMPPRRAINLPIAWFQRVGIERLLDTSE